MEYRGAHAIDSFHVVLPYLFRFVFLRREKERYRPAGARRRAETGDDLNLLMTMAWYIRANPKSIPTIHNI